MEDTRDLNETTAYAPQYEVIESLDDVEELEQRYEYETTVWLCKYTVHF